jgi:hypothetical protein
MLVQLRKEVVEVLFTEKIQNLLATFRDQFFPKRR